VNPKRYAASGIVLAVLGCSAGCSDDNTPGWGDDGGPNTTADSTIPVDSSARDVTTGTMESGADTGGGGMLDSASDAPDDVTHDAGTEDAATDGASDVAADSADDATVDSTTDAAADASADAPEDSAADVAVDADAGSCPVVDASASLMIAQPDPATGNTSGFASDWDDSFGGNAYQHMTATTECGAPATHWVQSGVAAGAWIKVYPNNTNNGALYYLASALSAGTAYTASVTLSGTGTYHLDFFDGNGGSGRGDNPSADATLGPTTATTLSVPFTEGTGSPELQLRVAGTGNVDVDVTIWNVTITQP
jgi:hypothetical protein